MTICYPKAGTEVGAFDGAGLFSGSSQLDTVLQMQFANLSGGINCQRKWRERRQRAVSVSGSDADVIGNLIKSNRDSAWEGNTARSHRRGLNSRQGGFNFNLPMVLKDLKPDVNLC